MAVSQFGNVPREVVNYHLIIVSKVGFYDLWISGVIEMELLTKSVFRKNMPCKRRNYVADFIKIWVCQQLRNDDSFKPLLFRRWGSNLDSHRRIGSDTLFSSRGVQIGAVDKLRKSSTFVMKYGIIEVQKAR